MHAFGKPDDVFNQYSVDEGALYWLWGKAEEAAQQHFLKMLDDPEVVEDAIDVAMLALAYHPVQSVRSGVNTATHHALSAIKQKLGAI